MRLLYCKSELSALIYFSLRYLESIGLEPSRHTEESRYRAAGHDSESRLQRQWEGAQVNIGGGKKGYEKGGGKKGSEKGGGKKGSGKGGGKKGSGKGGGKKG